LKFVIILSDFQQEDRFLSVFAIRRGTKRSRVESEAGINRTAYSPVQETIALRTYAGSFAEPAAEIVIRREAHFPRDFQDGEMAVNQEVFRAMLAHLVDMIADGDAGPFLENAAHIDRVKMKDFREAIQGQVFIQVGDDIILKEEDRVLGFALRGFCPGNSFRDVLIR
jgi:hypothetical protein